MHPSRRMHTDAVPRSGKESSAAPIRSAADRIPSDDDAAEVIGFAAEDVSADQAGEGFAERSMAPVGVARVSRVADRDGVMQVLLVRGNCYLL